MTLTRHVLPSGGVDRSLSLDKSLPFPSGMCEFASSMCCPLAASVSSSAERKTLDILTHIYFIHGNTSQLRELEVSVFHGHNLKTVIRLIKQFFQEKELPPSGGGAAAVTHLLGEFQS